MAGYNILDIIKKNKNMNNTLESIQERLTLGSVTSQEASNMRVILSGTYAQLSTKLEAILAQRPKVWLEMRKLCKSDKATDRQWEGSEMGLEEMSLHMKLKRIEKMMSSLSSLLRVAENEAKNIY